jgi:hypothetical protein
LLVSRYDNKCYIKKKDEASKRLYEKEGNVLD